MNTEPGFPIVEVLKHLDNTATSSLSSVSKNVKTLVGMGLADAVLWKTKSEKALNLTLPFTKDTNRWKDLYYSLVNENGKYDEAKLTKQLATGKYEYVWIAYMKELKITHTLLSVVLQKVVDLRDFNTLELIFDRSKVKEKNLPLRSAICNNDTEMFTTIVSMFEREDNKLSNDNISGLISYSIMKGSAEILEYILELELETSKHDWEEFIKQVARSKVDGLTKARMLENLLKFISKKHKFELFNYECKSLSKEEAKVMVDSGKFELDELYPGTDQMDPEAALIFYMNSEPNSALSDMSLFRMMSNDVILSQALDFHLVQCNCYRYILSIAMQSNNKSFEIIVNRLNVHKDQINAIFDNAVDNAEETPFLHICNLLSITVDRLESSIMLCESNSFSGKIPLFIKLGVSLKLVGEKLAFNGTETVIRQLHELGFSFNECADDLLMHYAGEPNICQLIVSYLDFMPIEQNLQEDSQYSDTIWISVRKDRKSDIRKALDSININWKLVQPRMFHILYPYTYLHPEIKVGAKSITHRLEKNILRGLKKDSIEALVEYLEIAIMTNNLITSISRISKYKLEYDEQMIVKITSESLKTKYRGLDMFSSTGYPLTTRESIKARRRELLPR